MEWKDASARRPSGAYQKRHQGLAGGLGGEAQLAMGYVDRVLMLTTRDLSHGITDRVLQPF